MHFQLLQTLNTEILCSEIPTLLVKAAIIELWLDNQQAGFYSQYVLVPKREFWTSGD